ncbi:unnamed protein product [Adineta ricciae]|uniref:Uncharacterized protein n=1 Tax=Adineta ricciae TaxID=249248 RepID=A0A816F1J4_ADIRI|nr:unnamed protein product [Adineta ricciae]CAF1653475.1 unnamed protein product [Adineta ricciae]
MVDTYNTEEQRIIDRIKCIVLREARDAGATFINRHWVAKKIHRSIQFATNWWQKPYDQCFANHSNRGRKLKLSGASRDITRPSKFYFDTLPGLAFLICCFVVRLRGSVVLIQVNCGKLIRSIRCLLKQLRSFP